MLNILLTPGNNALVNHTNANTRRQYSAADTFTITSVAGLNKVAETVLPHSVEAGGSGRTIGGADFDPHPTTRFWCRITALQHSHRVHQPVTLMSPLYQYLHGASSPVPLATTTLRESKLIQTALLKLLFNRLCNGQRDSAFRF